MINRKADQLGITTFWPNSPGAYLSLPVAVIYTILQWTDGWGECVYSARMRNAATALEGKGSVLLISCSYSPNLVTPINFLDVQHMFVNSNFKTSILSITFMKIHSRSLFGQYWSICSTTYLNWIWSQAIGIHFWEHHVLSRSKLHNAKIRKLLHHQFHCSQVHDLCQNEFECPSKVDHRWMETVTVTLVVIWWSSFDLAGNPLQSLVQPDK